MSKPASTTPLTSVKLGEALVEAGFPAGAINLVVGHAPADWDVGRALKISAQLEFGAVWINDHIPLTSETPHGGSSIETKLDLAHAQLLADRSELLHAKLRAPSVEGLIEQPLTVHRLQVRHQSRVQSDQALEFRRRDHQRHIGLYSVVKSVRVR